MPLRGAVGCIKSRDVGPNPMSVSRRNTMGDVMTSDEYAENGGDCCPACDEPSGDFEYGAMEIDGHVATMPVLCPECNWSWTDVFTLSGYHGLTGETL